MSSLIVQFGQIEKIKPHPNADRLEIIEIFGWQVVTQKDKYTVGDIVLHIPIDVVLPQWLSDTFGVTPYLSKGRVRAAKLRGEPSFGFVVSIEHVKPFLIPEAADAATALGITKYEPPVKPQSGDSAPDREDFPKYSSVENLRNFNRILVEGEQVVVTEKIHGTNCRIGVVSGEFLAGSRTMLRKRPIEDGAFKYNLYWFPFSLPEVRTMVEELAKNCKSVVVYGEVFGKVQSLHYGVKDGLAFRVFDINCDGQFINHDQVELLCANYNVPIVPKLYEGAYSIEKIRDLATGTTTLSDTHIREGVVVKPIVERRHPSIGRVIMKYVSDAYLFGEQSDSQEV